MKQVVINLIKEQLKDDQISILKLGPKLVPTNKKISIMEAITATESTVLDVENQNKGTDAEPLRQKVSDVSNV